MCPPGERLCNQKIGGSQACRRADEARGVSEPVPAASELSCSSGGRREVLQVLSLRVLNECSGFGMMVFCSVFSCRESGPFPGSSDSLWEQQMPSLGGSDKKPSQLFLWQSFVPDWGHCATEISLFIPVSAVVAAIRPHQAY